MGISKFIALTVTVTVSQLHRVLHMPEYALLRLDMPGYGYASDICPDMFKYAEICVNMPKST